MYFFASIVWKPSVLSNKIINCFQNWQASWLLTIAVIALRQCHNVVSTYLWNLNSKFMFNSGNFVYDIIPSSGCKLCACQLLSKYKYIQCFRSEKVTLSAKLNLLVHNSSLSSSLVNLSGFQILVSVSKPRKSVWHVIRDDHFSDISGITYLFNEAW